MFRVWYVTIDTDSGSFERSYLAEDGYQALDKAAKDYDGPEVLGMGASLNPSEDWDAILQNG